MWIASSVADHLKNSKYIKDIYLAVDPQFGQRLPTFRIIAFASDEDVNNHVVATYTDLDEAKAAFEALTKELEKEDKVFRMSDTYNEKN